MVHKMMKTSSAEGVVSVQRRRLVGLHDFVIMILSPLWILSLASAEEPKLVKHQITGLFSPDREKDLRDVFEQKLPQFKLVSIDFKNAEASFDYDPAKIFPGAKPEQVIERFDNELRNATRHTFGAKPLRTIEKDKLKLVEIPIVGLDCKACSFAVYEMVYRLKGVEMATASFQEGKLTALIDPEKIDRTEIEMTLKQRGVPFKPQE